MAPPASASAQKNMRRPSQCRLYRAQGWGVWIAGRPPLPPVLPLLLCLDVPTSNPGVGLPRMRRRERSQPAALGHLLRPAGSGERPQRQRQRLPQQLLLRLGIAGVGEAQAALSSAAGAT